MEEQLALLQMREDEVWELLRDPTLPPLDRQELDEEIDDLHNQIIELEHRLAGRVVLYGFEDDDDDETLTIASCESESIGPDDEYDRECVIIEAHFDLSNEI